MHLLTAGDDNGHIKALKNLILSLPQSRMQERELFETWSSGDAARFDALIAAYFKNRPEAREFLVGRRNRDWLGPLKEALARPESTATMNEDAATMGGADGLRPALVA